MQILGVPAVENRERLVQADARRRIRAGAARRRCGTCRPMAAPPARCLVRRAQYALQHLPRPPLHFRRRAPRKRQEQDALRIGAVAHEMRDAVGERVGLAGAGAGDDQQRTVVWPRKSGPCSTATSAARSAATRKSCGRRPRPNVGRRNGHVHRRVRHGGRTAAAFIERSFYARIPWASPPTTKLRYRESRCAIHGRFPRGVGSEPGWSQRRPECQRHLRLEGPRAKSPGLLRELEAAEAYEQKLRQTIVNVRDAARGRPYRTGAFHAQRSAERHRLRDRRRRAAQGRLTHAGTGRPASEMRVAERTEIGEWIVSATLAGTDEIEILAGIGERLNAAGISMVRISVATDLLDPMFDGRGVRWLRDEGGVEETFARDDEGTIVTVTSRKARSASCCAAASPRCAGASMRRIAGASFRCSTNSRTRASPTTWHSMRVGEPIRLGGAEGIAASWTTDAPDGFTDAEVDCSPGIMPPLTLSILLRTTSSRHAHAADDVSRTGTPQNACSPGNIVRGRAEPIRAVVWFSDLVSFTRISDTIEPGHGAGAAERLCPGAGRGDRGAWRHVLKFIGDGILAIFPDPDTTLACTRALDAAAKMRQRIAELNVRRAAARPARDRYAPGAARRRAPLRQSGRPAAARLHRAGIGGQRGGAHRSAVRARSTRRSSCPGRSPRRPAKRGAGS